MVRKVAMPEPTAMVLGEASSPSSGDAAETSGEVVASRRKRPLEPADDSRNEPPAKRERKETDPPVHDLARAAWEALAKKEPNRPDFRKDELVSMFSDECTRLRLSGRANQRLKRQLGKFLNLQGMFHKSERPGAPQESFVLVNPEYKHVRSRDTQKKNDPAKKGDQGSGGSNDDDVVLQEAPNRATVPIEWTAEAYKPVRLSPFDKSHGITFVGENTVKGMKGYRMVRATNGVSEGDWYFECTVMPFQEGAVRLGWSMRRCDVETPVGFDAYGFGLRDRSGEFVHMARRKPYGDPFTIGDVIGCRIVLPELTDEEKKAVADAEDRWLQHRFVSYGQGQAPADSGIDITIQAKVEFFKNGNSMGIPALFNTPRPPAEMPTEERNVELSNGSTKSKESVKTTVQAEGEIKKCMKAGVYYPTVALFQDAIVQANFGPNFKYGIPEGSRPLCESARDKPVLEIPVENPTDDAQKVMEGEGKSVEASTLPADELRHSEEKVTELGKNARMLKESDEKPVEGSKQVVHSGQLLKQDGEHPTVHLAKPAENAGKLGDSIEGVGNVEKTASDGKDSTESAQGSAIERAHVPDA